MAFITAIKMSKITITQTPAHWDTGGHNQMPWKLPSKYKGVKPAVDL